MTNFAISTFLSDRRHQAKVRRRILSLFQEYPERVAGWLRDNPQHELREVAVHYQRCAAKAR
jgi:hypothetical protein